MKYVYSGAAALLISTAPALAGGIDRSGQFLGPLWEPGNYAELSFGYVKPQVEGTEADLTVSPGVTLPGGTGIGNVTDNHSMFGLSYKHQFNENWSAAVILDQPYGADIQYPAPATDDPRNPSRLGGTRANLDSNSVTGVVRFTMPENGFGVHGGIRALKTDANVDLRGAAYGPVNGYSADFGSDTAYGWLAGVSWERPDIAARIALTYNSAIEHEFDTTETLGARSLGPNGTTEVEMPESLNLEFQTGLNQKTLLFGSIRWVEWSSFKAAPPIYSQFEGTNTATGQPYKLGSLTDLEDSTTFTIGVGRKFTENWSGAASFTYEKSGNELVSPLAPVSGRKGITLAAIYTQDKFKITTGISYMKLGDASPETGEPDAARAYMDDSHAWGVGVKVGYSF